MFKKGLFTRLLLLGVLVLVLFIPSVSAQQYILNDAYLGGNGKVSDAQQSGDYFKYVKVTVKAKSSSAKYTVSLIGTSPISGANSVSPINTSTMNFTGDSTYIIYILPRSGMSCPSGASYCFGAGSNTSGTTVIQGNECSGSMCSLYGVRVNNKKLLTGYNIDITYEFFK